MPNLTTTSDEPADAASAQPTPDGATPPAAATPANNDSMSVEEARATLRGLRPAAPTGANPLLDDDGRDPLTDEGLTMEEVLGIGPEDSAPVESEAPAPAAEEPAPEPVAEPAAEAVEQPNSAETALAKTEADGRKRLNINRKDRSGNYVYSDFERAQMALADEEGISLAEAGRRLGGNPAPATEAAADAAKPAVKTRAEIDAEIAQLEAAEAKAAEQFDDAAEKEAARKIRALLKVLPDAVAREQALAQARVAEQSVHERAVNESIDRATGLYPDAAQEGTPLHSALQAETDRLAALKSPLLNDPEWPETIVAKVANRLGIVPKVAAAAAKPPVKAPVAPAEKPAAAKPASPPPARKATAVPSPGSVSGQSPATNPRAELEKQIETERDPAKLQVLMREAMKLERRQAA